MNKKVQAVLDEIRPMLQADGVEMEFLGVSDEGVVRLRLQGACATCAGTMMSLRQGIELMLKERVPEVKEVTAV